MSVTLYVPRDAVALGLGANKVARALFAGAERRGLDATIVRTGSRGLFWLEPMVEVATPEGRIAYGPVKPEDVGGLLEAPFPSDASAPSSVTRRRSPTSRASSA